MVLGISGVNGQAFTGTYSFAGAVGNVASLTYNGTAISNLTVSALVKTGVTTSSSSGNSRATTWPTGSTNGGAAGGSIDLGKYYEFTITGATGYTISNPSISFGVGRSATGPRRFEWRSSLSSYASALTVGTANASLTNTSGVLESPDAGAGYTGNLISITTSGQNSITFRFYAYGSEASGGTGGLEGNLTFSGTLNSSNPTILTSGSLTSFVTSGINSPSAEQSFTVSGSNLTNDITITPPTGYQVSTTSGSGFGSSVVLNQSGGTVASTTVYARFNPSALADQVGGNITCVSTGATTQNVAVSGEVTNLSAGAIAFIAFQGVTTDYFRIVALEDIPANTRIWFTDKAWDGNGGTLAFTSGEGSTVWTSPNSTVNRGTVIEFAVGAGTVNLGTGAFTSGLGSAGEQLFAYQGTLTSPTFIAGFTSGTTIATGVPTASGTDTWVPASLTNGTNFIALGGITFGSSYLTASTINRSLSDMRTFIHNFDNLTTSNTSTTTYSSWPTYTFNFIADEPTSQPSFTASSSVGNNQMDLNFSGGNGTSYIVVMREGSAVSATPIDATNYSAVSGTVNFSSATELSAGQKIVYNGTTSTGTVTVTNLSPGTTYHYAIYAYNGTTTTANFNLTSPGTGSQLTTGSANSNASDIIVSATFTEPSDIAYASNQENTNLTFGNSIEVAQFTLRDGGATTDGDANSTTVNSITFTISNHAALRRLALYDGSSELAEVAISSGTATFSGLTLAANDNSSKDFSLRASFAGTIADNTQFSFTVSSVTADIAGSTFTAADAGAAVTSTTGNRNRIEVSATLLAFVQNTSNVSVLTAMSPAPTVSANDALGNRDLDYVTDMEVTTSGTFAGAATTTETPIAGLATFDNLQFQDAETGINIAFSSGALTPSGNSNDFDITSLIMPGDITFVRYQTDAPDAFSILTFVEIPANQTFYFTDNAWTTASGPLNTNENT
ncbi:MAG: beta strand repeat-containing protein, partial [Dolichospermum sp.]